MALSKEQLLEKRFEVIAPYPHMPWEVGDILIEDSYGELKGITAGYPCTDKQITIDDVDKHPHLFKPLSWWEKRQIEDFPAYVKILYSPESWEFTVGSIRHVSGWTMLEHTNRVVCDLFPVTVKTGQLNYIEPATKEEYLEYINSKK